MFFNITNIAGIDSVDEKVALEDNWTDVDSKLTKLIDLSASGAGSGIVGLDATDKGLSAISRLTPAIEDRIAAWTGSAWKKFTQETWGAWQTLNLLAPFVARTNFTPQYRVSNYNNVQFRGCVINTAGASAWPTGYQEVNRGQILTPYLPSQLVVMNLSAAVAAAPTPSKGQGYLTTHPGPPISLRMYLLYENGPGGGNWIDISALTYQGV